MIKIICVNGNVIGWARTEKSVEAQLKGVRGREDVVLRTTAPTGDFAIVDCQTDGRRDYAMSRAIDNAYDYLQKRRCA
jgi:hypothetical protein